MLRFAAVLIALFLPSAWYVWQNQDLPHFGVYHDDGLYFIGAKSIAQTGAYRIESFPGAPYQTKYPPLLSYWHSLAWHISPTFPANLRIAIWMQWIWLPAFAVVSWLLLRSWTLPPWQCWIAVCVIALNPFPLYFSTVIMSELPCAVFLLLSILLLQKERIPAAAILAGLAVLTRTPAALLLLSVPALLLWRKSRRDAILFAAILFPFVAGWTLWSNFHRAPAQDLLTAYYTDYIGYFRMIFDPADLPLMLWKNVDGLFTSLGAFLLPAVHPGMLAWMTVRVLGVAAIAGMVRLVTANPQTHPLAGFAILYTVMLLVWPWPPEERMILPVLPLVLAGFLAEFHRIAGAIRISLAHRDRSQRIAARLFAAALAALFAFCFYTQAEIRLLRMPELMASHRARLAAAQPAYEWIRRNIDPGASILAAWDSSMFLYTGRRATDLIISQSAWYREVHAEVHERIEDYARKHGLDIIVWSPSDRHNHDLTPQSLAEAGLLLRRSPSLTLLHEAGDHSIYRVNALPPKTPEEHSRPRP